MSPDKDAVVQAMRSDLGLGRVDDLELENGHRGQGLRLGQNTLPAGKAPLIARPRNPIPVANRWKDAIQKGEFDDDDAEMVKGLDRIGGGRLHALNSGPSFPPPSFAVRRPPASGGPMQYRPSSLPQKHALGSQGARGPAVYTSSSNIHRPAYKPEQAQGVFKGMPLNQASVRSHVAAPVTPRASSGAVHTPPRPPPMPLPIPAQAPSTPRIPDPEPANYYHRVEIGVADRQAKGRGVVFLVESPATEADMLYVYLEGSVYLDYPLLSMFNYLTTDTQLCPQFREADGVSITTTALVFGSQAKMVDFMRAVKALKAKKPAALPVPNMASVVRDGSAASPGQGSTSQTSAQAAPGVQPDIKSIQVNNAPKKPRAADAPVAARIPTTASAATVPEPASSSAVMTSDLVDLSDTSAPNQFTRANRLSTYAMDLESLSSSPTQPASESSSSGRDNGTHGFRFVPFHLPSKTKTEPKPPMKSVPGLNTSTKAEYSQAARKTPRRPQEMLQSCLRTILPVFEEIDEILGIFDDEDRLDIMESVVSRVQASEGGRNSGKYLSSAEILLQALASGKQPATVVDTAQRGSLRGPRYGADDILRLRQGAIIPAALPPRLKEIASTTIKNATAETTKKPAQRAGPVTPTTPPNDRRGSMLRPDAVPFQPSPDRDASPTAAVSDTPSLEVQSTGLGKKGLQGSRWATADSSIGTAKMFIFKGIDPLR